MRLAEGVYIVGGGRNGLGISNDYDCNVYLLNGGEEMALIDAGVGLDTDKIISNISSEEVDPAKIRYILLTHGHADHSGGSKQLRDRLSAEVAISREEAEFIRRGDEVNLGLDVARAYGVYPSSYHLHPCEVDIELEDDQQISIGRLEVKAIATPGHSKGSICYLLKGKDKTYLFSGDTVFCGGTISLLNCVGSSLEDYRLNISKLAGLGVDGLLPGHVPFCLGGGQEHIDRVIEAFKGLWPPKNAF